MIYDTLKNLTVYSGIAPEAVALLAEKLPQLNSDTPNGKIVLIEDKLFILIQRYNTRSFEESKVETHSNFADLQMLLDGSEKIGYADTAALPCLAEYNAEADYALFGAEKPQVTFVDLKPGCFAIFFPEEGHMPGCGDGSEVTKAVIKIHKSLLK